MMFVIDFSAPAEVLKEEEKVTKYQELLGHRMLWSNYYINKNECIWKAVEWAGDMTWRTLKASFESEEAAQEFHSNYLEGLNYAQQVGIIDDVPHEQEPDTEFED
nr:unnamed protein product [Callosobruchus chinensis]